MAAEYEWGRRYYPIRDWRGETVGSEERWFVIVTWPNGEKWTLTRSTERIKDLLSFKREVLPTIKGTLTYSIYG